MEGKFLVNTVYVKEGDTEAGEGKKLGEFEHGVDMALSREGEDQNVRHVSFLLHGFLPTVCCAISHPINSIYSSYFLNHYLGFGKVEDLEVYQFKQLSIP